MHNKLKIVVFTFLIVLLSGCCGKIQSPYVCPSTSIQPTVVPKVIQVAKPKPSCKYRRKTYKKIIVHSYDNRYINCAGYNVYGNSCVVW